MEIKQEEELHTIVEGTPHTISPGLIDTDVGPIFSSPRNQGTKAARRGTKGAFGMSREAMRRRLPMIDQYPQ